MSATESSAPVAGPVPEELARANVYGLLARLFFAAPDQQLLGELVRTPPSSEPADARTARGREFVAAWNEVVEACRSAYPVVLENEHTELFNSPGKAQVTPYLLHYVIRYESETPLVSLREQMARWGIARRAGTTEPEDHVALLCEVMRMAIAVQQRPLEEQKAFYERFVHRGAVAFCGAVTASPNAPFYRLVAKYALAFFDLEHEAFSNLS